MIYHYDLAALIVLENVYISVYIFFYISVYLQYTIVYHLSDKLITIKKKNINYKPNENAQDNHTGLPV